MGGFIRMVMTVAILGFITYSAGVRVNLSNLTSSPPDFRQVITMYEGDNLWVQWGIIPRNKKRGSVTVSAWGNKPLTAAGGDTHASVYDRYRAIVNKATQNKQGTA
jgi:hypothetical protein